MDSDTENKLNICRLCLQTSEDVVNVWNTFQDSTIASVVNKHFWFGIHKSDILTEWLCQTCWLQTKSFHEFYKQIELLQKRFYESSKRSDQKDISDKDVTIDTDLSDMVIEPAFHIVKCEETDVKLETFNSHISSRDSSEDEINNISDNEKQCINNEHEADDDPVIPRKGTLSLSEKTELEAQIREMFNMKCQICSDVEFSTLLKAKQHYRKVHKTQGYITCCGRKYFDRFRIVKHVRHHIDPDAYHCDQCKKSFSDERALKSHIDNHVPLDSRKFKCSLCPSSFTKEYPLKVHVRLKHTSKTGENFPCDKCCKSFRSSYLLTSHIRQCHLAREYVCEVCARTFNNKHNLERHVKNEHSSTPPPKIQCDVCGVWVKHINLHRKLHEESQPLKCPICNKDIRSERLLRKHVSFVHGEKRHRCSLCDKVFKRASMLKEHFAIHTGEDLYNCTYCDKKFKSNANMYKHRKTVHSEKWTRDRDLPQRKTSTKVSAEVTT